MSILIKLVKTDVYKLLALGRVLLLYVALIILFSLDARTAAVGYLITFYMLLYAPMAYDEAGRGMHMLCILPVTRRQIVQGKYLYTLLTIVAINLVVIAVSLLSAPFLSDYIISAIPSLPTLSLTGVAFAAIMLPGVLYLGVTKARYLVMGIYMLGIMVATFLVGQAKASQPLPEISGMVIVAVTVVLLGVSYLIACRLFERRQFTD